MTSDDSIRLMVNGQMLRITVSPHRTLLEALRQYGFVDVKCGCEKGDCGACAVLVDGEAIDSCLTLARTAEGKAITTVAGLAKDGELHPLQSAFVESGAVQCGYCTPGLIIAAQSLLARNLDPQDDDIRLALSGNLCRCTGYTKVFQAIKYAAIELRQREAGQ